MRKVPGYRGAGCGRVGQPAEGPGCGAWGWLRGPGASHLCGPCLLGCSGPAAAGPGCKASPRPSSRRAAVASAPTWCQMPQWGKCRDPGLGSARPGCRAAASPCLVVRATRRLSGKANQRAPCWEAVEADAHWAGGWRLRGGLGLSVRALGEFPAGVAELPLLEDAGSPRGTSEWAAGPGLGSWLREAGLPRPCRSGVTRLAGLQGGIPEIVQNATKALSYLLGGRRPGRP